MESNEHNRGLIEVIQELENTLNDQTKQHDELIDENKKIKQNNKDMLLLITDLEEALKQREQSFNDLKDVKKQHLDDQNVITLQKQERVQQ